MKHRTLIIAEAGVNHNGSIELAFRLIEAAKASGADIIKFQTFKTEKIITKSTRTADYQVQNTGGQDDQLEMIKKLELSYEEFRKLKVHSKKIGIEFLSTPDEEDSLDFLIDELGLKIVKIGSGELNNFPYLTRIARKNLPIIMSTGMATLGEVERAIDVIRSDTDAKITLLHCTTNYPCPMEEVNIQAMCTLATAFKLDVGYSDHTLGMEVPIAAVALGACVIEKHFTLDRTMEGPDHAASMDPDEFHQMVSAIRNIEKALGDGVKRPNPSENRIKEVVRKRVVAARDLAVGEILTPDSLVMKRSNEGLFAEHLELVLGRRLKRSVNNDCGITWNDLMGGE